MCSGAVVCGGGRVALVLQFVLCWGSALPTLTPSKGLWLWVQFTSTSWAVTGDTGDINLDHGDRCASLTPLFPGEEIRLAIENWIINSHWKAFSFFFFPPPLSPYPPRGWEGDVFLFLESQECFCHLMRQMTAQKFVSLPCQSTLIVFIINK